MIDILINIDIFLFNFLNQTLSNSLLDNLCPILRTKTTWIPLYLVLLIYIFRKFGVKSFGIIFFIVITVIIADFVSSECIKKTVERLRPCNDNLTPFNLLLEKCGSGYSFTSSHATNHFALAMSLFLLFKNSWQNYFLILIFIWAAIISISQVYVGVHYPFDILFGALLGCSLAFLSYKIFKKIFQFNIN